MINIITIQKIENICHPLLHDDIGTNVYIIFILLSKEKFDKKLTPRIPCTNLAQEILWNFDIVLSLLFVNFISQYFIQSAICLFFHFSYTPSYVEKNWKTLQSNYAKHSHLVRI
jgi:hypothetical protein